MNRQKSDVFYESYKQIIDHHVEEILESGLLLDEDHEVLINSYNFKTVPVNKKKYCPSLKLVSCVFSTFVSVVVAKKCNMPLLVLPPAILTLGLVYLDRKDSVTLIKHKNKVSEVVKNLGKVGKLNIAIIRYMKTRADLQHTKEKEYCSMFNQNLAEFVKLFTKESRNLFNSILNKMEYLVSLLPTELEEGISEVKEIDLNQILCTDKISNIEECVIHTSKIQDIFTLLVSRLLSYLGITLHSIIDRIDLKENNRRVKFLICEILDTKLQELLRELNSHTGTCLNEFNQLKYSANKKIELRLKPRDTGNKHISNKLQQALMSSINNLSVIMERSHAVLSNVESVENADDSKEFANAIKDLRDHAYATYESLDVLCRLYGILLSSKGNENKADTQTELKQTKHSVENTLTSVSFNDNFEATEENYELFISDEQTTDTPTKPSNYRNSDQSSDYLNLMIKELRQSLKQHDRFVAAKRRRGSEPDDEITDENLVKNCEKARPKFDLSLINATQNTDSNQSLKERSEDPKQTIEPTDPQRVLASPVPPPVPPPPPPFLSASFKIENLQEESGRQRSKSMLENIKLLSSQIQTEEEIFGDSGSESDL